MEIVQDGSLDLNHSCAMDLNLYGIQVTERSLLIDTALIFIAAIGAVLLVYILRDGGRH